MNEENVRGELNKNLKRCFDGQIYKCKNYSAKKGIRLNVQDSNTCSPDFPTKYSFHRKNHLKNISSMQQKIHIFFN